MREVKKFEDLSVTTKVKVAFEEQSVFALFMSCLIMFPILWATNTLTGSAFDVGDVFAGMLGVFGANLYCGWQKAKTKTWFRL